MIEVKDLCAGYPGKPVLQGIDANFPTGKITAVLGPNGCGKTTLLKALCGVLPVKGHVLAEGIDLLKLPPKERARQVAYLSQNRSVPDLTVGQLVLCGRYPHSSWPRTESPRDEAAVRTAMERLDIGLLADAPLSQLSGGQRQKAYIAMALAQDAPVLLLDEPTTYLDVRHQLQLLRLARELADEGKTVIAVLHDLQSALQTADHILLLDGGEAVTLGTPEEVFRSGLLDRAFGVRVCRTEVDGKYLYHCQEA